MSPWVPRIGLALLAGVVLGAIISLSVGEGGPQAIEIEGGDEVVSFYAGMTQDGARLGEADAGVEIDVFTDLRATQSVAFHAEVVRPLVDEYVRDGRALLTLRHRSLGNADVTLPAVAATIAGEQARQWQYADLVLRNLEAAGLEAGAGFLADVADALRGASRDFDAEEFKRELEPCADEEEASPCPQRDIPASDDQLANELEIPAQPALVVTGPGGSEALLDTPSLEQARAAIARVGAGG